jgi:hypothetical protein
MKYTFYTHGIFRMLLIAAFCLAGSFPSTPTAAAPPQGSKMDGQARASAGYKGPGFVLVKVDRAPLLPSMHDAGHETDPQGNLATTRWDSDNQAGDSSYTGTFKVVDTVVEKNTGNSQVFTVEKEGSVSWTPPPAVAPPGFVYQPQPKFSGTAKTIGARTEISSEPDLEIAGFDVTDSWAPDNRLCEVQLAYGPNGIKTWANKPVVFPDLKKIQEVQEQGYPFLINIAVGATRPDGVRQAVVYVYEARPEVTLASTLSPPQVLPKPPEKPVAPPRAVPAPTPARVSTPEITPKPPAPPVPSTPKPSSAEQHFEVYNLGDAMNILQSADKPRGTLSADAGKLKYQEAGKTVFSASRAEITEIDANTVLGYDTGTFHVILKSGKTYNFAPASLNVADGQKMRESIKHALR